jgi:hypothetical protein
VKLRKRKQGLAAWTVLGVLTSSVGWSAPRPPPRLSEREIQLQLGQVEGQLAIAEDNLRLVEAEFVDTENATDADVRSQRFSQAETKYLLGDISGSSILLYDVVSDPGFRDDPRYPDALWYLGDGLFQQENPRSAQLYLRELLDLPSKYERNALARYLEIAGRLKETSGVEALIERARRRFGTLPPEVQFAYGKWWYRRPDVSRKDRLERARELFGDLLEAEDKSYRLPSLYFVGVIDVERTLFDPARKSFLAAVQGAGASTRDVKIKDLSLMALARLATESGKLNEAMDLYQQVSREGPQFSESLYELAWVHVRQGDARRAKIAIDLLLAIAAESTWAPAAQLLLGHLELKLQHFPEAKTAYSALINTYQPVYDEMDALLRTNKDPVAYFDRLIAQNEQHLDVHQLLPPAAAKWALREGKVGPAVQLVSDLEAGRREIADAKDIAARIRRTLDQRGVESFPALQEGFARASAVASSLLKVDQQLVTLERASLDSSLTSSQREAFDGYNQSLATLDQRFKALPTTPRELEDRRGRLHTRIDQDDQAAFQLGFELLDAQARAVALQKWMDDGRPAKDLRPKLESERALLSTLQEALLAARAALNEERAHIDVASAGEELVRDEVRQALATHHRLLAEAEPKATGAASAALKRAHQLRDVAVKMTERTRQARAAVQKRVLRDIKEIRAKLQVEEAHLLQHNTAVGKASTEARKVVGQVAFDSFRQAREEFYELILKADVGLVDVAFTRKQDKTTQIQKLSIQKDADLKAFDEEFSGIVKGED